MLFSCINKEVEAAIKDWSGKENEAIIILKRLINWLGKENEAVIKDWLGKENEAMMVLKRLID
jgi:hypothetical protein